MRKSSLITALFLDIGGVLFTDGGGLMSRQLVANTFDQHPEEMESRHTQVFHTYELGKLAIEEYLSRMVSYEERPFTPAQFRKFKFAQSQPYPEMIELVRKLKAQHGLKVAVVSNEAREINSHRIRKCKLDGFVDYFVFSGFIHLRKPDADIFHVALDIAAPVPANQVVYIENLLMFVQVAEDLGIRGICHMDY